MTVAAVPIPVSVRKGKVSLKFIPLLVALTSIAMQLICASHPGVTNILAELLLSMTGIAVGHVILPSVSSDRRLVQAGLGTAYFSLLNIPLLNCGILFVVGWIYGA